MIHIGGTAAFGFLFLYLLIQILRTYLLNRKKKHLIHIVKSVDRDNSEAIIILTGGKINDMSNASRESED